MSSMECRTRVFVIALAMALGPAILHAADGGSVVMRELRAESLTHNLIGTNPVRKLAVYLPPGKLAKRSLWHWIWRRRWGAPGM